MKYIITLWLMLLPLLGVQAQENDSKYLAGAVPVVEGRVVFEKVFTATDVKATQLYQAARGLVEALTVVEGSTKNSTVRRARLEVDNQEQHTIIVKMNEWLTFKRTALVLDRAQMTYTMVLTAEDGQLKATIKNISYINVAQEDMPSSDVIRAENWITDEHGLNKKQTKLAKISGKFRAKTIDRVNELFDDISHSVEHLR